MIESSCSPMNMLPRRTQTGQPNLCLRSASPASGARSSKRATSSGGDLRKADISGRCLSCLAAGLGEVVAFGLVADQVQGAVVVGERRCGVAGPPVQLGPDSPHPVGAGQRGMT